MFWRNKKNNRHTTPPHTHIAFIMPLPKGIGRCHKSGTGNNQGKQQTTPYDNRCSNCKYIHSKRNNFSSPVISVFPPFNNPVINPPQISSVGQHSSRSSQNTPCNNRCFNSKDSNSKSNELSSPLIPVPPPLNDSVINPPQQSSSGQQSSRYSHNTTHELKASSIPGWTLSYPSNIMLLPSTNNGSCNIYGCMVDVSKLTPSPRQQHAVMSLHNYHELCNTNDPSSICVSPPPIPNIGSLSQSTISSLDSG